MFDVVLKELSYEVESQNKEVGVGDEVINLSLSSRQQSTISLDPDPWLDPILKQ